MGADGFLAGLFGRPDYRFDVEPPTVADLLAQAMVDPYLLNDPGWRELASRRLSERP